MQALDSSESNLPDQPRPRDSSGFLLVAVGAALWGSDALFRRGLAMELPPAVVVAGEHLILTAVLLPALWRAGRRLG
ncbi:MAG TPA: hypothetical protein VE173_01715, partial [Longimicrobiales bacterium]|nr:hypothetical protein [Longimicrobiales bacterium]